MNFGLEPILAPSSGNKAKPREDSLGCFFFNAKKNPHKHQSVASWYFYFSFLQIAAETVKLQKKKKLN